MLLFLLLLLVSSVPDTDAQYRFRATVSDLMLNFTIKCAEPKAIPWCAEVFSWEADLFAENNDPAYWARICTNKSSLDIRSGALRMNGDGYFDSTYEIEWIVYHTCQTNKDDLSHCQRSKTYTSVPVKKLVSKKFSVVLKDSSNYPMNHPACSFPDAFKWKKGDYEKSFTRLPIYLIEESAFDNKLHSWSPSRVPQSQTTNL